MTDKFITTPFAAEGSFEDPPDAVQVDGSVSWGAGYTQDYERTRDDPARKEIERTKMNGILNVLSGVLQAIQQTGAPTWFAEGAPYPVGARVRRGAITYVSVSGGNTTEPGTPGGAASWVDARSIAAVTGLADALNSKLNIAGANPRLTSTGDLLLYLQAAAGKTAQIEGWIGGNQAWGMGMDSSGMLQISNVLSGAQLLLMADRLRSSKPLYVENSEVVHRGNIGPIIEAALNAFLPKRSFTNRDFIRIPDRPGGLVLQWGQYDGGSDTAWIQFPTPFPNWLFAVLATGNNMSGSSNNNVKAGNWDTGGFLIRAHGNERPASWFAIGF